VSTLVLSRRAGESIEIGPNVTVEILSIAGKQCRIAITAPLDVHIRRTELPLLDKGAPKP